MTDKPLPDFKSPPLIEVALSVQFEPLEALRTAHLGKLWLRYQDRFPRTEDQPRLESAVERFESRSQVPGRILVDVNSLASPPRVLFIAESGEELVQIQQDRFAHNWRRVTGESYPRYPQIRTGFEESLSVFEDFVREEALGELQVNQCEITYVNLIDTAQAPTLADLIRPMTYEFGESYLPEPEDGRIALRFIMRDENSNEPLGRLYLATEPRVRLRDGQPVHHLKLMARGAPIGRTAAGILEFLDRGREWIVRGFAALTTKEMHNIWERVQ